MSKLFLLFFVSSSIISTSTVQAIPSAWVQYIKCVIDAYENSNCPLNGIDSQCGVPPRMLFHNDIDQNSHVVYNPTLILWNPLNQYHAHAILQCPVCQGRLRKWRWKDGSCARDNPRKLVGLQNNVFLVSCVYLCEKFQHEIIGHDPALLTSLRTRFPFLRIPFVLFHKSGVTRELYEFISSSIQTGLPLMDIEKMIIQLQEFPEFYPDKEGISRKLISKIFLQSFLDVEHMYI